MPAAEYTVIFLSSTMRPHWQAAQGTSCTHFSAYRVHADDPLLFHDGLLQTWRNGDPSGCAMRYGEGARQREADGEDAVPLALGSSSLGSAGLNASSLALLYEWDA